MRQSLQAISFWVHILLGDVGWRRLVRKKGFELEKAPIKYPG
jgi:hypothetical protein